MSAVPASQTIRTPGWIAAAVGMLGALSFLYFSILRYCVKEWADKPEYSHGFFVVPFCIYLAWRWRDKAPTTLDWPNPWGLALIAVGAAMFYIAGATNIAQEWVKGISLVVNLCGVTLLLGGFKLLRWLWPCLVFLLFMFPLPYEVSRWLGWQLQRVATIASTFLLQTIGYPAYAEGNVIHIREQNLEVANACNGLSMLLTFLAMAVAVAILINRPLLDRILVLLSAIPIAVISNIIRIVATGILYMEAGKDLGDRVFHDFAGWLMMPLALGFMWLELKLLDWLFVADLAKASREEVIKSNNNPAYLFMLNNPALGTATGNKPSKPAEPTPGKGR